MLQINECTITHKKDLRTIIENCSFVLNGGDKAVIIGEEGNGKSTLMKWIYDPALIDEYVECQGNRILGKEILGYLPQELPAEEQEKTIYEYYCEQEAFFDLTPGELADYARDFHVPQEFFYGDQTMGSLSGGEKVKAQLMRLFMGRPTILLLDEPSNDIDMDTLELLEKLIQKWEKIVLFISHDETLIEHTANMVIHFEQIQRKTKFRYTVARMPYRAYVEDRLARFESQDQKAANERKEQKKRDEKFQKIYQEVEHAQAVISRQAPGVAAALKRKMHTVKAMERRYEREDENMTEMSQKEEAIFFKLGNEDAKIPAGKTVLEYRLEHLKTPDDKKELAHDIFLRIRGAEKVCIIGSNGAGKTTLLKKIASDLLERTDIRAEYMPQHYEELLDLSQTPVEYLEQTGDKAERTRIRTYLGSLKYTADEMDHPIAELSGGQKAKVLLLKMSLSQANVLILDEPTRNFSPLSGPVIRQMIHDFPGAVISISHDRKYIEEVCDKIYVFTEDGLQLKE